MAKHWIQSAIKHPGALKAAAAEAGESTHAYAEAHKHDSGKTGDRARLALTLMGMHHGPSTHEAVASKAKSKSAADTLYPKKDD